MLNGGFSGGEQPLFPLKFALSLPLPIVVLPASARYHEPKAELPLKFLLAFLMAVAPVWAQASLPAQALPQSPSASASHPQAVRPCSDGADKIDEARFHSYLIRTYAGCLEIFKQGKLVYSLENQDFKIGGNFSSSNSLPLGTDVTGLGQPDAIVTEFSGGMHCCFTLHVFELGDQFREAGRIESGHSDTADFADLKHDRHYEFVGWDWAFAYWKTSFAESPAPRVVLTYQDGAFLPDLALMRTPAPSPAKFEALVLKIRSDDGWSRKPDHVNCDDACDVPVALWKNMLDLLYGGHTDLAWQLLHDSWPARHTDKSKFISEFCVALTHSQYWPSLSSSIGPCSP